MRHNDPYMSSENYTEIQRVLTEERAKERQIRNRLASLNNQLSGGKGESPALVQQRNSVRREYEEFEIGLYTVHPELRAWRGDVPAGPLWHDQIPFRDCSAAAWPGSVSRGRARRAGRPPVTRATCTTRCTTVTVVASASTATIQNNNAPENGALLFCCIPALTSTAATFSNRFSSRS